MVLVSVVSGVLIARWLGAEGVGIYAVLTLTAGSLVQITASGLTSANVYYVARRRELLPTVTINAFVFAIAAGAAAAAAVCGLAYLQPEWFHHVPLYLLALALAALPFQIWTLFGLNLLLALGEVTRFNVLDALSQSFVLINALVIMVLLGLGLEKLIMLNTATAILIALFFAFEIWRRGRRETIHAGPLPNLNLFAQMMRFGLKINVMNAALVLILRADVLLVNYFRGAAEAGVYAIAGQCSLLVVMFPNVVGTILFPRVAGEKSESREFTSRVMRHAAAIQLVLCVFAIPAAFVLPFLYGPQFTAATWQFLLLLPGAYLIGLQMILSQHLVGIGKISMLPFFWILTLLLSLGLNLWLIPGFGGYGAAVVSTIVYSIIFLLTLGYFCRKTGERLSAVLFLRREDVVKLWANRI